VSAALGEHVGLILDAGAVRGGVASSVVAVRADGSLRILREGALTGPRLEEALA
jgi:tRNA A37 threonylcarbamoyladenosine synthetase subunit TsaC/SUA5/YrdC